MIPNTRLREVATNGVAGSVDFAISTPDTAHIMTILRDAIYTDKVQAVLREYSANAWDAHREAGKADLPIRVQIPTDVNPTLTIRDFGAGLSHEAVFEVFTKYGASTKRDSNTAVGMLGIGSKAGFAYSDSFTVVTWHGGTKRTYVAVLDPSDKGMMNLFHSEDCGDETGVEIQIPVSTKDIWEFQEKAATLYQYFNPRPEINIDLPAVPETYEKLPSGAIYVDRNRTDWVAVMGCIAYRVNISQLHGDTSFAFETYRNIGGALYFDVGELQFNASREELKYSDKVKKSLVEKFHSLTDEFLAYTLKKIEGTTLNPWQKRLEAQIINYIGLELPQTSVDVFAKSVLIKDRPSKFTIIRSRDIVHSIGVHKDARLIVSDDRRSLRGFNLGQHDYVVKPLACTADTAEDELNTLITTLKMDGIPLIRLSTLPWVPTTKTGMRSRIEAEKHRVKNFRLIQGRHSYFRPYSNNWETETERVATDDDVYVVLSGFQADYDFYTFYRHDEALTKAFGKTLPEVYGYKSTAAKPAVDCKGTEYRVWRKEFHKSFVTDETRALLAHYVWARATERSYYTGYYGSYDKIDAKTVASVEKQLGSDHPISQFVRKASDSQIECKRSSLSEEMMQILATSTGIAMDDAPVKAALQAIRSRYPMMTLREYDLNVLWASDSSKWFEYIKLVDKNS